MFPLIAKIGGLLLDWDQHRRDKAEAKRQLQRVARKLGLPVSTAREVQFLTPLFAARTREGRLDRDRVFDQLGLLPAQRTQLPADVDEGLRALEKLQPHLQTSDHETAISRLLTGDPLERSSLPYDRADLDALDRLWKWAQAGRLRQRDDFER
jgi:hypothetical protein